MRLDVGEVRRLEAIEFDLPLERILETPPFPKWSESRHSRDKLRDITRRLRTEVLDSLDPRGMYSIVPVEDSGIREYRPPEPVLDAAYVCSLVVTAGELSAAEDDGTRLFEGLVRDAIENVALGHITEAVAEEILDVAEDHGWGTTRMFAPGSGSVNWSIENRRFLFESLPAADIGVRLRENGLVEPNKTITAVLGMGPNVTQAPDLRSCVGCPRLQECPYADTEDIATVTASQA